MRRAKRGYSSDLNKARIRAGQLRDPRSGVTLRQGSNGRRTAPTLTG